jgi:TonB-dependent SusC/RagA subfamily outer membrane receptor
VTQVRAADVTQRVPVTNMQEMLAARSPGLQFHRSSGVIGTGSEMRIRGVSSLTLGRQPMIFIDGIRVNNSVSSGPQMGGGSAVSTLDDLNPNDIESIEIIKGPAAATLYGTEASAGVVQIITKRGAAGSPVFDVQVHQGVRYMRDPAGTIGTFWGCRSTPNPPCPMEDLFTYNPVDEANRYIQLIRDTGTSGLYVGGPYEWNEWPCKEIFCNGHMQTYSMNVRGGTETLRYFVSGEMLDDNGILYWNTNRRANVRANLDVLFTENFSFAASAGYVDGSTRFATPVTGQGDIWDDMQWGSGYCLARINPTACPRLGGFQEHLPTDIAAQEARRTFNRFIGSATAQHVYGGWLTQRAIFGVDRGWDTNINFQPLDPVNPTYAEGRAGQLRYERPIDSNLTVDYAAGARYRFNDNLLFTTSAGIQYYYKSLDVFLNTGRGFALPIQRTINQTQVDQVTIEYAYTENKSLGAYVQEEVNWQDRLFFTAAVRADDNSAFGSNFDAQYYPKVSAAWVISEEPFWTVGPVNTLRLRTALGQAGRQPGTFDGRTVWESYRGPAGQGAVIPVSPGNPDIGPEVSTEIEAGFDVALLNDRLSGEFTYYRQKTEDALLNTTLPSSMGRPGSVTRNLGRVDNWGWEASLDARVVERDNFRMELFLSADYTMNEIKGLGDFPATNEIQVGFPYPNRTNFFTVLGWSDEVDRFGRPLEVWCDSGAGLNRRFPGGDPVPCQEMAGHELLVGPGFYTRTFSVSPTFTLYNNLQLFAVAEGMYGKIGNEAQVHWGLRYNNGYCTQVRFTDPECMGWNVRNRDGMFRDIWAQDAYNADFWKLREIGARFDIPSRFVERIRGDRASFSIAGQNLLTIWQAQTHIAGRKIPDPEFSGAAASSSTLYQIPAITTITGTLRVTF